MNSIQTHTHIRSWRLLTLTMVLMELSVGFGQAESTPADRTASNDMLLSNLPNTKATRNVWRDRTSPPKNDNKETQSKKKLQDTLNKLKSLRFAGLEESEALATAQTTGPKDAKVVPESTTQKQVIIIRTPAPKALPDSPNTVPIPNSELTKQTTDAMVKLAQSPEKLQKPESLGQILFQGQAFSEAALCYEEALKRLNIETLAGSEDKEWLLFQIGNCYKQSDPQKAMRIYKQLILEYPHSLWSELVRVKGQWITWELRDKPKTLVNEIKARASKK
jgi:tetratricopeptide (TPR) repeat protein